MAGFTFQTNKWHSLPFPTVPSRNWSPADTCIRNPTSILHTGQHSTNLPYVVMAHIFIGRCCTSFTGSNASNMSACAPQTRRREVVLVHLLLPHTCLPHLPKRSDVIFVLHNYVWWPPLIILSANRIALRQRKWLLQQHLHIQVYMLVFYIIYKSCWSSHLRWRRAIRLE